ncbi:MAG: alpha-ketoglutarate-dependent dioxygenase AlkB [Myxococcota bacterium]
MLAGPEAVDRKARVERTDLGDGSWVDVVHGFVREPEALFGAVLRHTAWRQLRRRVGVQHWIDVPRLGGTLAKDTEAAQILRHAGLVLDARYRARMGGYALLQYRDGNDSIGLHRDRELRYLEDTISVGLSLGGIRPFCLRPRFGGEVLSFMLEPGDLYVMGGRCQADWMHGVPKVDAAAPKISAIWRWTSKRGRPEPREAHETSRLDPTLQRRRRP